MMCVSTKKYILHHMTFDNAQNKSKLKETITSENHSLHFDFDDFFFVYLNIML